MGALLEGRGADILAAMDGIVEATGATHAQVALSWLAAQSGVVAPIASATSVEQLDELIGSWALKLDADQLRALTDVGA